MASKDAIALLREVIKSPDCDKMNRSTVKGFLGELLVKQRLEDEGQTVQHHGNQTGYDLRVSIEGREVLIDVKMSLPKEEYGWGFEHWGWALLHDRKTKAANATHYVCVGCSATLEVERLFVVQAASVAKFPQGIRQFSKVKHALVLPVAKTLPSSISPPIVPLYTECQAHLSRRVVHEVSKNERLSDALA